jgi:N-methylhydantoinase B
MPDIGGRVRAIEARELFEEGIHIPLSRIIRDGERDQTLISLIRANVRTPDQTMGDIWAQVSANELMENRVRRLMEDYGLDSLDGLADELFGRSERAMREAIRAVPTAPIATASTPTASKSPIRSRSPSPCAATRSPPTTPGPRPPSRAPSTVSTPTRTP